MYGVGWDSNNFIPIKRKNTLEKLHLTRINCLYVCIGQILQVNSEPLLVSRVG